MVVTADNAETKNGGAGSDGGGGSGSGSDDARLDAPLLPRSAARAATAAAAAADDDEKLRKSSSAGAERSQLRHPEVPVRARPATSMAAAATSNALLPSPSPSASASPRPPLALAAAAAAGAGAGAAAGASALPRPQHVLILGQRSADLPAVRRAGPRRRLADRTLGDAELVHPGRSLHGDKWRRELLGAGLVIFAFDSPGERVRCWASLASWVGVDLWRQTRRRSARRAAAAARRCIGSGIGISGRFSWTPWKRKQSRQQRPQEQPPMGSLRSAAPCARACSLSGRGSAAGRFYGLVRRSPCERA